MRKKENESLSNSLSPSIPQSTFQSISENESKTCIVSFEEAHLLIENERRNDDSEFMEGGFDPGTLVSEFLMKEFLSPKSENKKGVNKKSITKKDIEKELIHKELIELYNLCRIEKILSRGLKFLSTGEMKKVLIFKSFLLLAHSKIQNILFIDLYAGLDFDTVSKLKTLLTPGSFFMERFSKHLIFKTKEEELKTYDRNNRKKTTRESLDSMGL